MGSIRLLNVWPRWCHDMRTDVHIPMPRGSECSRCIAILAAEKFCSSQGILARRWSRLFYVWPRWCHDMRAHLHVSMPRGSGPSGCSMYGPGGAMTCGPTCTPPCLEDPSVVGASPSLRQRNSAVAKASWPADGAGCSMYGPGGAMTCGPTCTSPCLEDPSLHSGAPPATGCAMYGPVGTMTCGPTCDLPCVDDPAAPTAA